MSERLNGTGSIFAPAKHLVSSSRTPPSFRDMFFHLGEFDGDAPKTDDKVAFLARSRSATSGPDASEGGRSYPMTAP